MRAVTGISATAAVVAAMTFGAAPAQAGEIHLAFSGNGVSGTAIITTVLNISPPDPDALCGTAGHNPCRSDPAGAMAITGVSGTFTDPSNNIFGAAITGLVSTNPANERDPIFDPLVPASLSWFDYDTDGSGNPVGISYSNLYYPAGTPVVCTAFPFSGTLLDVYGLAFTVDGGYTAVLWGDGDLHGPGTTAYGLKVVKGNELLSDSFDGITMATVPEPATLTLMALGLGALGIIALRRRSA